MNEIRHSNSASPFPEPRRVLVTGANGFIGHHLCAALAAAGFRVRRAVRASAAVGKPLSDEWVEIGDIGPDTNWAEALRGVQVVVHLAAHVHRLKSMAIDAHEYFRVNAAGTQALVDQSCHFGVNRFIFLSSTKVHGESSCEKPFGPADIPNPVDAYGKSKLAGENALRQIADRAQMNWVIVRPPLVYGPGVGANFYRLMTLVDRRVPLPFKRIFNKRSLLSVGNLCDLLLRVIRQPEAASHTLLISDDHDLSTSELIGKIANSMARRPLLFPVPISVLSAAGRILGLDAELGRLTKSLQVDVSHTRRLLGWEPAESVDDAMANVANWYLTRRTERI
jgi:UDP-N-acetyl-alpha-D-quinovosamine dehydrogenase